MVAILSWPQCVKPNRWQMSLSQKKSIPGPWFNIKMPSYQYRKSHCGDKTILRSSYLHNGISYTGKMASFILNRGPDFCLLWQMYMALNNHIHWSEGAATISHRSKSIPLYYFVRQPYIWYILHYVNKETVWGPIYVCWLLSRFPFTNMD